MGEGGDVQPGDFVEVGAGGELGAGLLETGGGLAGEEGDIVAGDCGGVCTLVEEVELVFPVFS